MPRIKWWQWVMVFVAAIYFAIFVVQFRYEDGFVDDAAPAASSLLNGKYSLRHMLCVVVPVLIWAALYIEFDFSGDPADLQLLRVLFWGSAVVFEIWSMGLLMGDIIGANSVGTGTSRCSDPLACCVEAIRTWTGSGNKCKNRNLATMCSITPITFNDLSVDGWCIAEFVSLCVILTSSVLILGLSVFAQYNALFSGDTATKTNKKK